MGLGKGKLSILSGGSGGGGGGTGAAKFSDSFAADTRANYTYEEGGSSAGVTVAGGVLKPASATTTLMIPTALAALKSQIVVAKFAAGDNTNTMALIAKRVSANNFIQLGVDNGGTQRIYKNVAGSYVQMGALGAPSGYVHNTQTWWYMLEVHFDTIITRLFDADPITGAKPKKRLEVDMDTTAFADWAAFDTGEAGKAGLKVIGGAGFAAAQIDDFKVYAGNDHPYDF